MAHLARAAGLRLPVTEGAKHSNALHLDHIAGEIEAACPVPLASATVAVWGATFKAGTDDTRDSPAIEIIERLVTAGASVTVFDPAAERERVPAPLVADPYSACAAADMLVVLTKWPLFATADLDKVTEKLATPVAYDTRAILDPLAAIAAGLTLHRPGRVTLDPVGVSLLRS